MAWTTEYYGLAIESLRAAGRRIDDEVLAHISPAHSENINFFGSIDAGIEAELAQPGPAGYRPLRLRSTLFWLPPPGLPGHGVGRTQQLRPRAPAVVA